MKFSLEHSAGLSIHSYREGEITIVIPPGHPLRQVINLEQDQNGNTRITESFILTSQDVNSNWPVDTLEQLQAQHVHNLLAYEPELIILGTGAQLRFPQAQCLAPAIDTGIGVEVMDTAAACRTFNILVSEGRHVVAGLLMI